MLHQRFIRANGIGSGRVGAPPRCRRVAHDGNGNRSRIAIGNLRLRDDHRARPEERRAHAADPAEEAVLAALGLGRVQPADHLERGVRDDPPLDFARGLLRAEQRDAAANGRARRCRAARRGAGSSPSRGAYLFSSSSTTNTSGREPPCCSFCSIMRFSRTPTTNSCAVACSEWMSTTVTCCADQSMVRLRACEWPLTRWPMRSAAACSRRRKASSVPDGDRCAAHHRVEAGAVEQLDEIAERR